MLWSEAHRLVASVTSPQTRGKHVLTAKFSTDGSRARARDVADVQAALRVADQHELRVTVRLGDLLELLGQPLASQHRAVQRVDLGDVDLVARGLERLGDRRPMPEDVEVAL